MTLISLQHGQVLDISFHLIIISSIVTLQDPAIETFPLEWC